LLTLAFPMVLARATQAVITACDAAFAAPLGSDALTATTTGGVNTYAFIILPMGTVFILQSFTSQLRGRGDVRSTRRFAMYGLALALASGVLAAAASPWIGSALSASYSGRLHDLMSQYMVIRLLSVTAVVGTEALGAWYGGLGNTRMQMFAGAIAMIVNVPLDWALIYGKCGFGALGVAGAAWANTIATWLGFTFIAVAFGRGWGVPAGAGPSPEPPGLRVRELGRVLRFGLPNGVNWFLEFAAFELFLNGVMPELGSVALGGLMIVMAINNVSFMPAFGLASSGAVLAGEAIGSGKPELVWPAVRLTLASTLTWMGFIGLLYVLFPRVLLGWFAPPDHRAEIVALGARMLLISAGWQLFDATAMTMTEVLRAAGDTAWCAVARIIIAWGIFTPMAFVAVRVFDGGPDAAVGCLVVYVGLLAAALAWRFHSGAWRNIRLNEAEPA
jgi:MATE family multidrug resistance protein